MQSNREADTFTCSLLQLLYSSYSHFFLALSLSLCRFLKTCLRVTETTVVLQNGNKKAIFSFRKIRKIVANRQQYEGDQQLGCHRTCYSAVKGRLPEPSAAMLYTIKLLDFKLSPCSKCCMLSSGLFPGVWILCAEVSEHSVCPIFIGRWLCEEWIRFGNVGVLYEKGLTRN